MAAMAHDPALNPIRKLYWLASYPKSGNTWVRMLIQAYHYGSVDINRPAFVRGDNDLIAYQAVSPFPLNIISNAQTVMMRPAALMQSTARNQYDRCILKTHHAAVDVFGIPLIPEWITQAAVYLVRDPRDVAISLAKHVGQTIDGAIDLMNAPNAQMGYEESEGVPLGHILLRWSQHVDSWCRHPCKPTVVLYEHLLANPKKHLRRILETYNYDIDEQRLANAVELCRIDHLRRQESKRGFVEASSKADRFFGNGTNGGWQDVLADEQVERIESAHGTVMSHVGYPVTAGV